MTAFVRSFVRSFVWSSVDSIHSVRFGQLLRCAYKHAYERVVNKMKVYMERKNRQLELIRFREKYRIYFFEPMKPTRLACLRFEDSRYNISMFDSNRFIRDTSPLFCAQSSHGKSLPDVHVR